MCVFQSAQWGVGQSGWSLAVTHSLPRRVSSFFKCDAVVINNYEREKCPSLRVAANARNARVDPRLGSKPAALATQSDRTNLQDSPTAQLPPALLLLRFLASSLLHGSLLTSNQPRKLQEGLVARQRTASISSRQGGEAAHPVDARRFRSATRVLARGCTSSNSWLYTLAAAMPVVYCHNCESRECWAEQGSCL